MDQSFMRTHSSDIMKLNNPVRIVATLHAAFHLSYNSAVCKVKLKNAIADVLG
jgi:hypothetical protein